jgi:hypothetical protein
MADGEVDREVKFRDAALVLADDVAELAGKLRSCVRGKKYERASRLVVALHLTVRDVRWLLRHLPKEKEEEAEK